MAASTPAGDITVEQYAGIAAALAEDLPLANVLAYEALSPRAWKPVEIAWKSRLAADGVEGPLFKSYSQKLAEAEDWLARSVAPLENDLAAWVSFLAAWGKHEAPFELLTGAGLRLSDVSRLQRRWSRRFAEDASLEKRAAELLKKGPGPVPRITAGEVKHKPYPWSRAGAAPAPIVAPASAAPPDKAPADSPPPPEALPAPDKAPPVLLVPSFMKAREQAPASALAPAQSQPSRPEPLPPPSVLPVAVPFGATADVDLAALGLPLPFAGKAADEEALSRAKQTEAARPPAAPPIAEIGKTGDVPADLIQRLAKGRLPFGGAQPSPSPPSPPPPSRGFSTETVELTPGLVREIAAASLPFKEKEPAPPAPSPPSASPAPRQPRFGDTVELTPDFIRKLAAGRPVPFQAGDAPQPAAPAPRLTLEQYASYRAELAVFKDQPGPVLARYGLADARLRAAEEQAWQDLLRSRPDVQARWDELHRGYVGYWTARSRGPR